MHDKSKQELIQIINDLRKDIHFLKEENNKNIPGLSNLSKLDIDEISQHKEIENVLRLTQYSVDSATDSILWLKPNGQIIYVNKATCEMLGYSKEELLYMKVFDIAPEYQKDIWPQHWQELKKRKSFVIQTLHRTKRGIDIPVETAINFFEYEGQEYNFAFTRDMTERKKIEVKLEKARDKAEEADRLKSAFLANMSHEIRTPMNAIIGFSELLLDEELTQKERKDYLNVITSSSNSLLKLIDDIIDISKIEAGQLKIVHSVCEINLLMDEIYLTFADYAKSHSLHLNVYKENNDPGFAIRTDGHRVKQILVNLISNAFKFTNQGEISFGYTYLDNNLLKFFVSDTGKGISEENLKLIFDRFRQIEYGTTRIAGGTGLGLTISKNMVELLDGEIWVESKLNIGTTFYFTIPNIQEQSNTKQIIEKKIPSNIDLNGKTILIAEDEESNYKFLEALLKKYKNIILWAKDGEEAMKIFENTEIIDLVLLDIHMPGLNGYEVIEKMKKINPKIPVIAQTAYAMQGEKEKCLTAGFNDYIPKPINQKILLDKIFKHLKI